MPPLTEEKKVDINNTLEQVKARASKLQGVQPSVSANELSQPPLPVSVPVPAVASLPQQSSKLVSNITRDVNGFITAKTDEAKQLKELQATYGAMNEQGSLSDLYNKTLEDAGVTGDSFKELKDISLQLSDMDTGSEITKTKIAGAEGQTLAQGQREVTQEDRENAVRSAGLAARAAVLQGNIETATAAAQQAVNIAFQDRQLTAQNLLNQIEMVQGQVDEQTGQLLEQEKRNYEAELAKIEEVKGAVADAMVEGASQSEVRTLTNPNISDDEKLTLANEIIARNNRPSVTGGTITTPFGQTVTVPTFEEWIAEQEQEALQTFTPEKRESLRSAYESQVKLLNDANQVAGLSVFSREMLENPKNFYSLTATEKGKVLKELATAGIDTGSLQEGKRRPLSATQTDDLVQAKLAREGVLSLKEKLDKLQETGPVVGRLRQANPYDPEVVAITAEINRILPGLARGIFKEVGVLTDQDIERYKATLANPSATKEQIEQLHTDTMGKIEQSLDLITDTYGALGYDLGTFDSSTGAGDTMTDDEAYEEYLKMIEK